MPPQLYLASRSPRRQELLRQLGVRFEVVPGDVAEDPRPGRAAADHALALALAKAKAGAEKMGTDPNFLRKLAPVPVLGADTDVVIDGEILGKPAGRAQALSMLARLSKRTHEVYSGVAVVGQDRAESALSVSRVTFGAISAAEAEAYWATGEPADKAGAYAIQGLGARFVKQLEGSYSGVMGLPLYETCDLLRRFGIDVFHQPPATRHQPLSS